MEPDSSQRLDRSTQRIEELIGALDSLPDQRAAALARELVQRVLDLHGNALARMMESITADRDGSRLTAALLQEDCINGVLLLHGLHPSDFETRVRCALERLHPHLGVQGVTVKEVEIADNAVLLRLGLSDAGRYGNGSGELIRREIERALFDAAPDTAGIEIEGLPAHLTFVPVSSITVRRKAEDTAGAHP